jgi:hypothetical protein
MQGFLPDSYSVYWLYWYKSTEFTGFTGTNLLCRCSMNAFLPDSYSVYWLYWYKSSQFTGLLVQTCCAGASSTRSCRILALPSHTPTGTQFTGFTGTKVQVLTLLLLL